MRILHVSIGMYYGGTEVHILTNCVAADFAEHAIFSVVPAPGNDNDFEPFFKAAGIPVYYEDFENLARKFDLVHLYVGGELREWGANLEQWGIPLVWTMVFRCAAPLTTGVVLCTSFQTLLMQPPENNSVLYQCAVDLNKFNIEKKVEHDGINLVRICRAGKSDIMLDEAIAELLNRYPECSYHVVGDNKGINHPRIKYYGRIRDIIPLLAKSDIFVYAPRTPSACTCDICVIEAMAMGLPVVSTDAWQVKEQISHGETGILTECNKDAIKQGIEYLLRNPVEIKRMGFNAYNRAKRLFDIDSRMSILQSVYDVSWGRK